MKKITLTLLAAIIGICSFAQTASGPPKKETKRKAPVVRPIRCPSLYISVSSGFNNNTGAIGGSFDVPVAKTFSIEAGAGTGTWGDKIYVGAKYYLEPCQRGWAFGTGFTYSTGQQDFQQNMETISGYTEPVVLNLHAQTNILFAAYRYWNLGRRYNRVYLELGWSAPLIPKGQYDQSQGDPISDNSRRIITLLAPGGIIAAGGFSFGVH